MDRAFIERCFETSTSISNAILVGGTNNRIMRMLTCNAGGFRQTSAALTSAFVEFLTLGGLIQNQDDIDNTNMVGRSDTYTIAAYVYDRFMNQMTSRLDIERERMIIDGVNPSDIVIMVVADMVRTGHHSDMLDLFIRKFTDEIDYPLVATMLVDRFVANNRVFRGPIGSSQMRALLSVKSGKLLKQLVIRLNSHKTNANVNASMTDLLACEDGLRPEDTLAVKIRTAIATIPY